ncbi:MAG: GTPase, partial [Microgenomates group bacterium]
YDFTTVDVIPGMMEYQGAKIQIFDLPGIVIGAAQGKGRGREVLSVTRSAELIIIMVDINSLEKIKAIKDELYEFGIRLDEEKPKMNIVKTLTGGIKISSVCRQTCLSLNTIKEIAQEFKIRNAEIILKEDITLERLIDAFMGNRVYLPYLTVVNKVDLLPGSKRIDDFIFISAKKGLGIEELKRKIWNKLGLMRIYLKPKSGEVDFNHPLITKRGKSLRKILETLSICNKEKFKAAKIYGPGAKFPGQEVSLNFQPQEGTIISFLGG